MKQVIYILFTLLILIIVLYGQSQYSIGTTKLEQSLSEYINEDITITQQASLLQTTSIVVLLESKTTKGYAILTKHRWMDKWKVEIIHNDIRKEIAQIITTNQGNYIVANGKNFSKQVTLNDGKVIEMELLNQKMPIYISKTTIAKKYVTSHIEEPN